MVKRRACEAEDLGGRRVVLLLLGSSNDDRGVVDQEVWHRARKLLSLWRSLRGEAMILTSGGKSPERFFNRTTRPHWQYVNEVLGELGVPESSLCDGLEALHTVDEALMARQRLLALPGESWQHLYAYGPSQDAWYLQWIQRRPSASVSFWC